MRFFRDWMHAFFSLKVAGEIAGATSCGVLYSGYNFLSIYDIVSQYMGF
jgi:hypothetical protein